MDITDPEYAPMRATNEAIKHLVGRAGLKYVGAPYLGFPLALGVFVGFGVNDYTLISVGFRVESNVRISAGVLKHVDHDELRVLSAMNAHNGGGPFFTAAVHQATDYWSISIARSEALSIMQAHPDHFEHLVRAAPENARSLQENLIGEHGLRGEEWAWDNTDHRDMLLKAWM